VISGRKHLSAVQAKQLKHLLPVVTLIQHMMNSSVFRSFIATEEFMLCLAGLMEHTVLIDCGETGVTSSGDQVLLRLSFPSHKLQVDLIN